MKKDVYKLSNPQKNIWDSELFFKNSNLNNIGGYVYIQEKVDFTALEKAINLYVKKNDALRAKIKLENGEPYQYIDTYSPFKIKRVKLKNNAEVEQLNQKIVSQPFNIYDSNLFSFTLFELPNKFGGFNVTEHHFISDAWSMSLLIDEIIDLYSSIINSKPIDDTNYPSYIDYLIKEQEYMQSSRFEKDVAFWNTSFSTEPEISYICTKNQKVLDTTAKRKIFNLPNDIYEKINNLCKECNCSLYTFFMAIYSLYLAKINNTSSPIVGTPVLNRSGFKEKHTSGMFISTIPFKVDIDYDSDFIQYLKGVSLMQLSVFKHQKFPYNKLLQTIKQKYNLSENLYDLVLSYQNARDDKSCSSVNYYTKWIPNNRILDSLEVHFYDMDNTGTLDIYYDYQINKFDEKDIENIHNRILAITNCVLTEPNIELKNIRIVTDNEETQILNDFNDTYEYYDKGLSVLDIFKNNVKTAPKKTAIVFEGENYSYLEIDDLSNKLANYILSLNMPKNSIIGIKLERSLNTIICMLAILKAGHAYMLIEKDLPEDRILYMLRNAKSPLLITSSNVNYVDFKNKIFLEDIDFDKLSNKDLTLKNTPDDLLSVVYTSGSTGMPKGVLIKRSSIVNLVNGYKTSMKTDKLSNFLSICSVAFDMFAAEVWISLLSCKKLILANEDEAKNPISMAQLIKKEKCEFMLITSSKLDLLLDNPQTSKCLRFVKAIQLGGEVLSKSFYTKLKKFTNAKIYNGYGPSETTSCCSCKFVNNGNNITLGKPLPNVQIYICNEHLNLCPIGIVGELCICGDGVSLGYVNNIDATNKNFVKNPFGPGLLYKSGDLAKWNEDGEIVYIGRNDFQIKIRGLRVELEEIDNVIKQLPEVRNSVTVIRKINNVDSICSFVVSSQPDTEKLKDSIAKSLPYYMVPSHIELLDSLPLTTNGKIDTKHLPEITIYTAYYAPTNKIQKILASLFEEYLNIEKVSIYSNFFELGGDSLIAIKIITRLNCDFNINLGIKELFSFPTIASLESHISSLESSKTVPEEIQMEKTKIQDSYNATSAQKRIFYTVNINKNTVAYNTPGGIIFDGTPNVKKLEKAINKLLKRHDALRTYFVVSDTELKQKILPKLKFNLKVIEGKYSNLDLYFAEFLRPFDLSTAPLFRAEFINFDNGKSALFIDFSHIICDGSSISIFVDELCTLYNGKRLPEKQFDYKDYSLWEEKYFKSNSYKEDEQFWLSQFKQDIPVLDMPTTYSRPNNYSFEGYQIRREVPNINRINSLCKNLNTTPYIFLLTVYYILLYKYTGGEDIIVGTPIIGRNLPELSNIMGMFVNTLALRNTVNPNLSFKEILENITKNCLNAFEHQCYPFDKLVDKLDIERDSSRNPLFDTMFVYQNDGMPEIHLDNIDFNYFVPDNKTSKFDFLLEAIPKDDYLRLNLEYRTKLFSRKFMKVFLKHYITILETVLLNVDTKISDICMLSHGEKSSILYGFRKNTLAYPKDKAIIELFEEQANKTPNAIAINYNDSKITYKELKNKVNVFAYYLAKSGIKKGDIVGTLLNRSPNLIISMLAIMKCGAVYLPIETTFPEDRIKYITENSNLKTFITGDSYTGDTFGKDVINIDKIKFKKLLSDFDDNKDFSNWLCEISSSYLPEDVIYSIYTSGSTGSPKGVMVMNKNLNNFISSFNKLFGYSVTTKDSCLATTSICFDVSIWEFFFTLLNGATLCLYKDETIKDIFDFCDTLKTKNITLCYIAPNILNEVYTILSQNYKKIKLNKILVGVEPIKTSIISKYFKLNSNMKIVNGYGPTETTICSTAFVITRSNYKKYEIVPIGKALPNLNAYILDKDLKPTPIEVPGELYISGDNVAKGYLNNDELTKEKYIVCPFDETKIMYATGDIVKRLPDYNIMFVGRNDSQVKIKGHRIELGEISNSILSYPSINKCIVLVKEFNGDKALAAYFTSDRKVVVNDLRNFLSLKLPFYSIPNYFVQLDNFVLTSNGKIDKNYLNSIELKDNSIYEPPHTDFEKQLVELWQKFLNIDKIGINDNFFDLGGDSLIAIRFQIEAFKLGLNISYADIFATPTIKQLSNKIQTATSSTDISNYDYSKITQLLEQNTLPISISGRKRAQKNILLTGVTGFVGIHILDKLLTNTNATIYCLIRNKNKVSYINRLYKTLQFYFGNKYDDLVGSRIQTIEGDITDEKLGLSNDLYRTLGNKLDCVINSAAIVKHYGNSSVFDKINIGGVENIMLFCEKFNIKLYHLSTLSVSGNVFAEGSFDGATLEKDTIFKEKDLFVNQDISNLYVYTKFIAERTILEDVEKKKLKACIIRLGNITNRASDGKFQINISENAFLNRILAFIRLGCIPDYLLDGYAEFTPVDYVADAISRIVQNNPKYTVFHLFNNKHVPMKKLISIFNEYGIKIDIVNEETFKKFVDEALNSDKNVLSGIINDFDDNKKLVYDSKISLNNDFTNKFLENLDFKWCSIGKSYLFKYLDYLNKLGYLSK